MAIKVIIMDIDGTLVNDEKVITPLTKIQIIMMVLPKLLWNILNYKNGEIRFFSLWYLKKEERDSIL